MPQRDRLERALCCMNDFPGFRGSGTVVDLLTLKILPLRARIAHHDYHHKFSCHAGSAKNYGEAFWIWDWVFGTRAGGSQQAKPAS